MKYTLTQDKSQQKWSVGGEDEEEEEQEEEEGEEEEEAGDDKDEERLKVGSSPVECCCCCHGNGWRAVTRWVAMPGSDQVWRALIGLSTGSPQSFAVAAGCCHSPGLPAVRTPTGTPPVVPIDLEVSVRVLNWATLLIIHSWCRVKMPGNQLPSDQCSEFLRELPRILRDLGLSRKSARDISLNVFSLCPVSHGRVVKRVSGFR
ncbi:unnamed protein product [Pleuronectes platessa]|uniref:Uncharacterized protein n=1 Tax=Pleuronectes platessa TaxID=8262 RepID=A0A9N7TJW7_PLEPL|nr:unnamed protein product [Pleuronectes platessa]